MTSHSFSTPLVVINGTPAQSIVLEKINLGAGQKDENWLQEKLHKHPSCLPIDEIEPAFGDLIPICMELSTPHGPIDNVFLTPTGDIVIAEVKLWRNPEMRRMVVAQALDYAASIFSMSYEEFERAVLKNKSVSATGASSLYEVADHPEQLDEAAFVDAINRNLRQGRALILIIGDGIRSETQQLMSLLEDYGNLQFTFALLELAVFTRPDRPEEFLICPRVLAKTEMLRRTVFDTGIRPLASQGTIVSGTRKATSRPTKDLQSISSEQFWEAMSTLDSSLPPKLQSFLVSVEELGVTPEFKRSLILRWTTPEGLAINLGYIERNGKMWTNEVHNKLPSAITDPYIRRLADAFEKTVTTLPFSGRPNLSNETGGGVVITEVADKLGGWNDCIAALIEDVRNSPDSL